MSLKPRPVDFEETWAGLKNTIQGVVTLSKVNRSEWNDRFSDVYTLCVASPEPYTNQLYFETRRFLTDHVQQQLAEIRMENSSALLRRYYEMWRKYSQGISFLNQLYSYLNQQHAKKGRMTDCDLSYGMFTESPSRMIEIGELGLDLWRTEMLNEIHESLVDLVLEAIDADRHGTIAVQTSIVSGVINSFVVVEDPKYKLPGDPSSNITLYEQAFEKRFLDQTTHYYQLEANKLIQTSTISEYMDRVISKLNEEDMRARRYLHPSSYTKVEVACHKCLVADHLPMLHGECSAMVANDKRQDMTHMYCLLKPLPSGLSVLAETFEKHVESVGLMALNNLKPETAHMDFVENIIVVHKKFKEIVSSVFKCDQLFLSALDKAFTTIINHKINTGSKSNSCRSPELLAKYCDTLLKKSTKGYSEIEVDDKLGQSVIIFKYIDDKDVFQKFYARNLARRLIYQLSHSMDSEEGMINRLKAACGYEFTNKLHRMFTDVSLSLDLGQKFNAYLKTNEVTLRVNFNMMVLQAGAWPLQQNSTPFAVPQILEKTMTNFETFYGKQFSGRKLTWLHHLSTTEVKVSKFLKRIYFITMQTYQLAILLQFESVDSLTMKELGEATQLNEDQLGRHVASLLDCKLLKLDGDGQDLNSETVVKLNKDYSNKRSKFKISGAVQKETPQEVEQTHVAVEEDRKIFMQAAIVRIMKSRKIIKHNVLVQEVLSMSDGRFCPTVPLVKKCIEVLIERQYLERTPNSTDEYSYIA